MVETPGNNQSAMLSRTEPIPNSSTVPPVFNSSITENTLSLCSLEKSIHPKPAPSYTIFF